MPLYGKFIGSVMGGYSAGQNYTVSVLNDTLKVMMTTSSYTPSQTSDQFKSDVTNEVTGTNYSAGGATVGTKTLTFNSGTKVTTFDAADVTWASSTISNARYAVLYKSTGTDSTSPLVAYWDFGSNQSSNNGDFTIQWNGSGIFALSVA